MRISIKEIKDYIKCPLYYKFKNIDGLVVEGSIKDIYREYIKTSIFYYYFSAIENKTKVFESILRKWESLWFSSNMLDTYDRNELNKMSNQAVMVLGSFYKGIASEKFSPIAVNFSYEALFGGNPNFQVTGTIDLIKVLNDRTRNSETQIVFFSTSKNYPDEFITRSDLEIGVASYAFRRGFNSKEDSIIISSILKKEDTRTVRSEGDYKRAEKIIRNVWKGIDGGVFYPTSNKMFCDKCSFRTYCLNERSIN